jgi:hypothetical protein
MSGIAYLIFTPFTMARMVTDSFQPPAPAGIVFRLLLKSLLHGQRHRALVTPQILRGLC